jgi:hypothetical protein
VQHTQAQVGAAAGPVGVSSISRSFRSSLRLPMITTLALSAWGRLRAALKMRRESPEAEHLELRRSRRWPAANGWHNGWFHHALAHIEGEGPVVVVDVDDRHVRGGVDRTQPNVVVQAPPPQPDRPAAAPAVVAAVASSQRRRLGLMMSSAWCVR